MAEAGLAEASATAYGVALVIQDGEQVASRVGLGSYTRITGSTVYWAEEGDTMPGQPIFSTPLPFYTPVADGTEPISIVGGRNYSKQLVITLAGQVVDITNAVFVGQIRQSKYHTKFMVQFQWSIVDGPTGTLRLDLTPEETWLASQVTNSAVWDLEMQLNGTQYTVVPESKVTLTPGVSQAEVSIAYPATASGESLDATTVNS